MLWVIFLEDDFSFWDCKCSGDIFDGLMYVSGLEFSQTALKGDHF